MSRRSSIKNLSFARLGWTCYDRGMKTKQVLNYSVHIGAERIGKKRVYAASCTALGLYDNGRTVEEALKNITSLIEFHIETLVLKGYKVPVEMEATSFTTSVRIPVSNQMDIVPA